ncbi:uncharacterized protein LOC106082904 [Stomoxys calcitrans]|uniref:uncharacterized protein LOC106082904 n=1 Tax=Stomoxys calcitrans TaxID=35570 RepID=UPI0027E287BF|nr:uncharacterized protein LOC106082904 [Stomoxys calcitrans]
MLRNQRSSCKCLSKCLNYQKQFIHLQQHGLQNKNSANIFRQGKIMGKLFGNRVTGSKKRWFPVSDTSVNVIFKQSPFGAKTPTTGGGGKNDSRRMTVLNKLFMTHITDLLATGEISEKVLGKGLQVSRVKISQDFAYVNVYWLTTGDVGNDALLEQELHRCAGLLRHELSQLDLMGVVPRIKFVKDKMMSNINQVEALLRNMDFGPDEENAKEVEEYLKNATNVVKNEFYGNKPETTYIETVAQLKSVEQETKKEKLASSINTKVPEMRHDVLGLDHKGIMLKILTKMRKSKQAWEQHEQQTRNNSQLNAELATPTTPTTSTTTVGDLNKINSKLLKAAENAEKFEAFLAKRRERKNTPERKKYRVSDHAIDGVMDEFKDDNILSSRQRQLYESEDYLYEDVEDKK